MVFYGFQKTTLIDYPNKIASLVFTGGCNFSCPYCHNPDLVDVQTVPQFTGMEVIEHLKEQKGNIEGLCITGGEPLLYGEQLLDFINEVKKNDIKVKLDTNGSLPDWLKKANVDYIAMDIKSSFEKYRAFIKENADETIEKVKESIDFIMKSGIDYEFRTTVVPKLVTTTDIKKITKFIIPNAKTYYLQRFNPKITLNKKFGNSELSTETQLQEMVEICRLANIPCSLRP